jgi:selenocysteine lyase/cysteine desulfurase
VQDVEAVGQICREHGTWYLVDACQSAGQLPLDVERIGCDFLSATFRKWLRGPRGAGVLYASQRALEAGLEPYPPDMAGGRWVDDDRYQPEPTARRFELWEKNYAILLGAKAAVDYALGIGIEQISGRVGMLAAHARQELSALPGVRVLDRGLRQCGIVTCHFEGKTPEAVRAALAAANINAGVNNLPSTALIDLREKGVTWFLRISPHYYNTVEEIDEAVSVLSRLG